jgi:hypothetical protein
MSAGITYNRSMEDTFKKQELPEKPQEEFKVHQIQEYVPLGKIFKGMDAERIDYVVEHLKSYVEKYREDRKDVCISDYSRIKEEYLKEIKEAIIQGLEVKKIGPKKKIIKGGLIATIGYSITIPLVIAFPVLLPYIFPEVMVSLIAEETGRRIYYGVKEKKEIEGDVDVIEQMPLRKFACALEDICYYPARTDAERYRLMLEKEEGRKRFRKTVKRHLHSLKENSHDRVYAKIKLPEKLENFGRKVGYRFKYYAEKRREKKRL